MGVNAAEDRAVKHAGAIEVVDILGFARGFFGGVETLDAVADGSMNAGHAAPPPTISTTASTIF